MKMLLGLRQCFVHDCFDGRMTRAKTDAGRFHIKPRHIQSAVIRDNRSAVSRPNHASPHRYIRLTIIVQSFINLRVKYDFGMLLEAALIQIFNATVCYWNNPN